MTFYYHPESSGGSGVTSYNGMPIPMTAPMLPPQHLPTYSAPAQIYQPRPMRPSSSSSPYNVNGQQAAQVPRNPTQRQQQPHVARPPCKPINKHHTALQKPKLPTLATPGNNFFGGTAVGGHHPGQPGDPSRHARPVSLLPNPTPPSIDIQAMLKRASQNFERDLHEVKTLIKERTNTDTLKAFIKQSTNTGVLEAKIDRLGDVLKELLEEFKGFSKVPTESSQLQRGSGGMCDQQALGEEINIPSMQGLGSMPKLEETQGSAVNVQARKTGSRGKRTAAPDQPTPSRVTRSRARAKKPLRPRRPGTYRA